jgi:MoxR-like ATPase
VDCGGDHRPDSKLVLQDDRCHIRFQESRRVNLPALRHRIILNFEAQAEGIEPDKVLLQLLEKVPEKAE